MGIKNSIDGDLYAVAKSVHAVETPKTFIYNNQQITTTGNKNSHIVLRGFHDGQNFVKNCNKANTQKVSEIIDELNIENQFIMVDCSHANSGKVALNQIDNAMNVVTDKNVNGIILESYLYGGIAIDKYGVSKTDECLSFADTEVLIDKLYSKLK